MIPMPYRNARYHFLVAGLLIAIAGPLPLHAVTQSDISAMGGDVSRSYLGTGRGVTIGILDGGINVTHPALSGSVRKSRDYSRSGTTGDEPTGAGHATGIAGLYAGHASDFTGLAPRAGILNARVINDSDYTSDDRAGGGLFWVAQSGAKVINMSFGNRAGRRGPLTSNFTLMTDYAAEAYGASIVIAAGNESDTAVGQTPAGAYNAFSIGALDDGRYNQVADFSNYAMRSDARSKPDLVAPGVNVQRPAANWAVAADYATGTGTSFSAPIVGGVLAQMIGYGQDHGLSTDPMLMKAILTTSATKAVDYGGSAWSARSSTLVNGKRIFTQPLDNEQGAGRVDAMAAYRLYSRTTDSSNRLTTWIEGRLRRKGSYAIDLGNLQSGQRIDASLAWLRHIGRHDNGNGVIDAADRYYEDVPIADFVLTLFKDGRPIAASDSDVDNLEHLSWVLSGSGRYALEIYRSSDGGYKREAYALAARVLNTNITALTSFATAAADGLNFAALASDSSTNVGVKKSLDGYAAAPANVPEPATGMAVVALSIAMLLRRRECLRR